MNKLLTSIFILAILLSISACGPYEAPEKEQPIEYSGGE